MYKDHFLLSANDYQRGLESGLYQQSWGPLWWRDIPKEYDTFKKYLVSVGHQWGWDKMNDRFSEAAMRPKLQHPETRLRELMDGQRIVGYTLIVPPAPKIKTRFLSGAASAIEIENIGLFPEECGKGMGGSFLDMQFADLFGRYASVYLSSSSTNHPHIAGFYQKMGMEHLEREYVDRLWQEPVLAAAG